jgi:ribosome maturation factor RimP
MEPSVSYCKDKLTLFVAAGILPLFTDFITKGRGSYIVIIKLPGFAPSIWLITPISRIFASEIAVRRERGRSLLLLYPMSETTQIQGLEQRVKNLISSDPDVFLVEIRIKPTNNIKVFVDGDQGVSIDKLVQYNRRLYRQLEEENLYPNGDFSLEVSSPGLDEPLKLHRQYLKNIGRFVEVITKEDVKKEGKLVEVTETGIVVEEITGKGKKLEMVQHPLSFSEIKSTRIQIKF